MTIQTIVHINAQYDCAHMSNPYCLFLKNDFEFNMIKLTAFRSCCQEVKGGKLQCFMLLIESLITVFCSSDIFTLIILSHERKLRNYPHRSSLKSIVPSLRNQILNCSVMNFMHEIVMKYVRISNNYCRSLAAIFGVAN